MTEAFAARPMPALSPSHSPPATAEEPAVTFRRLNGLAEAFDGLSAGETYSARAFVDWIRLELRATG